MFRPALRAIDAVLVAYCLFASAPIPVQITHVAHAGRSLLELDERVASVVMALYLANAAVRRTLHG